MKSPDRTFRFRTERLLVDRRLAETPSDDLLLFRHTVSILSKEVTSHLPEDWQGIGTPDQARSWLVAREAEGALLLVTLVDKLEPVGFLILSETELAQSGLIELRLGYVLSKEVWGQGLGSELIAGLVSWCETQPEIALAVGGVEVDNGASIRILEKNGFTISERPSPDGVVFLERRFRTAPGPHRSV